jgi:hypothetical protein
MPIKGIRQTTLIREIDPCKETKNSLDRSNCKCDPCEYCRDCAIRSFLQSSIVQDHVLGRQFVSFYKSKVNWYYSVSESELSPYIHKIPDNLCHVDRSNLHCNEIHLRWTIPSHSCQARCTCGRRTGHYVLLGNESSGNGNPPCLLRANC